MREPGLEPGRLSAQEPKSYSVPDVSVSGQAASPLIDDPASLPRPYGPDLSEVIEAWETLADDIRARILALVRSGVPE